MHSALPELEQYLEDLAGQSRPGDRLPPIRELMSRFGASQMVVQRALQSLKDRGLIDSHVGRGTFFRGGSGRPADAAGAPQPEAAAARRRGPAAKSVLLLRRSISIARGRVLAEGLQRRLVADGHRVLEVSYTDPDHARTVLRGLPRFDACVVQSSYRPIPIDLLAALKDRSDVLAIDGAALVGADVEAVGVEWGEPLAAAVAMLRQQGHRRIACAMTSQPFLATQMGWRRFHHLGAALADVELQAVALPQLPDQDYADRLVAAIEAGLDAAGQPPFTALVCWGIEDGARFRALLEGIGIEVPQSLSVVLLGRTDLANEHAGFFHMAGCSVADQIETLYQAIQSRWNDPAAAHGVRFTPVTFREGASVAGPPAKASGRSQRRRLARSTASAASSADSPT